MKMNTSLFSLLIAVLMLSGCSGLQRTPTVPATETATQPILRANVTCNRVSFNLDPSTGSGYECQTIPEASGGDLPYFGIHPEYTEVILKNYAWMDTSVTPKIDAFSRSSALARCSPISCPPVWQTLRHGSPAPTSAARNCRFSHPLTLYKCFPARLLSSHSKTAEEFGILPSIPRASYLSTARGYSTHFKA